MSSLFDEYNTDPKVILKDIQSYLEDRQYEAYAQTAGLCNPVVSKNPFISPFLNFYLLNEFQKVTLPDFCKTFFYFLLHSFKTLIIEILLILIVPKKQSKNSGEPLIISFFNFERKEQSLFDELYMPGLQSEFLKKNINYSYLPKLHLFPRNPFRAAKAFKEIKKSNPNFINPYEYVFRRDIFFLVYINFAHFYLGLKTLRFFSKNKLDSIYNKSLITSLKTSEANKFLYYLAVRNYLSENKLQKLILWYENQSIDKCIIRAVREKQPDVEIAAIQFFLVTPRETNLFPGRFEIEHNLIPDSIFIMQDPPEDSPIRNRYKLGKGLRYSYLEKYKNNIPPLQNEKSYPVFLSVYPDKNKVAFELLKKSSFTKAQLIFKKHPALKNELIPVQKNWHEATNETQENLIVKNSVIFVTDSGLTFEAIALGRQAIIFGAKEKANQFIPPAKYQNKLWAFVTSPEELESAVNKLKEFRNQFPEELTKLALEIRAVYFKNDPRPISEILGY